MTPFDVGALQRRRGGANTLDGYGVAPQRREDARRLRRHLRVFGVDHETPDGDFRRRVIGRRRRFARRSGGHLRSYRRG